MNTLIVRGQTLIWWGNAMRWSSYPVDIQRLSLLKEVFSNLRTAFSGARSPLKGKVGLVLKESGWCILIRVTSLDYFAVGLSWGLIVSVILDHSIY